MKILRDHTISDIELVYRLGNGKVLKKYLSRHTYLSDLRNFNNNRLLLPSNIRTINNLTIYGKLQKILLLCNINKIYGCDSVNLILIPFLLNILASANLVLVSPIAIMSHCHQDKYAVIRNQKSGLVLDASEYVIKLQHFTGYPAQLWKLENAGPGNFFIVNKATGKVLDIQGGARCGNNVITYGKHGGINQQWFVNSDDTIVSAAGNLALDICRENYSAGNNIIAYNRHGGANQKFHFQYQ